MSPTKCIAVNDETGKPCLCLKCTLPDNPNPETPLRCLECFHGPSYHCGDSSVNSSNPGKRSVNEILRGLIGQSSASGSRSVSLTEANEEANKGLKGSHSSRGTGKTTGNFHSRSKGKKKDDAESLFKVLSITINADGVECDDDGKLQVVEDGVPGKFDIQMLSKQGLAKMDEKGIPLRTSWTYDEVDEALRELFPKVFAYLDALETPGPDDELHGIPSWLLCVPMKRRLRIVPDLHPTGSTLHFNKGTTRAGFRESKIFIVTRNAIPEAVRDILAGGDGLPFGVKGKGKAVATSLFASSPDSSDSENDTRQSRKRRKRRSESPMSSGSDREGIRKRRSKRKRVASARYADSGLLNDTFALEIGSESPPPTHTNQTTSSDDEWKTADKDWIDLTVDESLASGSRSRSAQTAPTQHPNGSPLLDGPLPMTLTTPPRPTIQLNPSFTVASSDHDNDLDDPWAENRTFTF